MKQQIKTLAFIMLGFSLLIIMVSTYTTVNAQILTETPTVTLTNTPTPLPICEFTPTVDNSYQDDFLIPMIFETPTESPYTSTPTVNSTITTLTPTSTNTPLPTSSNPLDDIDINYPNITYSGTLGYTNSTFTYTRINKHEFNINWYQRRYYSTNGQIYLIDDAWENVPDYHEYNIQNVILEITNVSGNGRPRANTSSTCNANNWIPQLNTRLTNGVVVGVSLGNNQYSYTWNWFTEFINLTSGAGQGLAYGCFIDGTYTWNFKIKLISIDGRPMSLPPTPMPTNTSTPTIIPTQCRLNEDDYSSEPPVTVYDTNYLGQQCYNILSPIDINPATFPTWITDILGGVGGENLPRLQFEGLVICLDKYHVNLSLLNVDMMPFITALVALTCAGLLISEFRS